MMVKFDDILARAQNRKGGEEALNALLPKPPIREKLKHISDDRILAEMAKRVFCAGFVWKVIEAKWPGFEAAFLGFNPEALVFQPNEFWDGLLGDPRIVRNATKIFSVRENAIFVREIADEYGSFGQFLAAWPATDQIGLMAFLSKRGKRLGGNSGQLLLRHVGWDSFVLTTDVVACLRQAGLDIAPAAKSKGDLAKVQAQFNAWVAETGLPYGHLSKICALSVGENYRHHPDGFEL